MNDCYIRSRKTLLYWASLNVMNTPQVCLDLTVCMMTASAQSNKLPGFYVQNVLMLEFPSCAHMCMQMSLFHHLAHAKEPTQARSPLWHTTSLQYLIIRLRKVMNTHHITWDGDTSFYKSQADLPFNTIPWQIKTISSAFTFHFILKHIML
jgi:hypothetical protein